jgi:predicted ATPase
MIRTILLQNFKCFRDQAIELGALTLLAGLNGMGKSSVLQSLVLLRQSYQQALLPDVGLSLNGDLIKLGLARDVLYDGPAPSDDISFTLWVEQDGSELEGKWSFSYDQEADVLQITTQPEPEIYKTSLFTDAFHYLQAERIGPRTAFDTSNFQVRQHRQIGTRGEYAAHFLSFFGNRDIPNPEIQHPKAMSLSLQNQVEAWLSEISPGTRLNITPNPDIDQVSLRYSFVTGELASNAYRSTNVGFGLTYTLPILVAALSAGPGALLLIENPEAHLHPRGQGILGDLLARVAQSGVQVVIETHSDHVLNGIRLAVHGGGEPSRLDYDKVQLHFFKRREGNDGAQHVVDSLQIDRDGRIDLWPEDFFDEWDKSLEALLEPRSAAQ